MSWASPGRRFIMMFPQHSDSTPDVRHEITITAQSVWTSVTVEVLNCNFTHHLLLTAGQYETVRLPFSVEMTSSRSPHLLSVRSTQPVLVMASCCTQACCDHSLLHDVSSWGTHYYPIIPEFPNQTAVNQVLVISSDQETSVDVVLSGEVVFEGNVHPRGSVLSFRLGVLESIQLQSNTSLSGSEILSQKAVCVVVGFTCSKQVTGDCSYGFAELTPISRWGSNYVIPPLVNIDINSSVLLAMSAISSELEVTMAFGRKNMSVSRAMKVIPVQSSDEVHITSNSPSACLLQTWRWT